MYDVTAGGPGFVAVGSAELWDGPAVWTSVDGISWSRLPYDETVFGGAGDRALIDVTAGGPSLRIVSTERNGVVIGHELSTPYSEATCAALSNDCIPVTLEKK